MSLTVTDYAEHLKEYAADLHEQIRIIDESLTKIQADLLLTAVKLQQQAETAKVIEQDAALLHADVTEG